MDREALEDENWEKVMHHFNELHGEFTKRLKSNYPELTPKDLKVCTYLKMNLSTKEIATLMGITTRGLEASPYRLRKKMGLAGDTNLNGFLMES